MKNKLLRLILAVGIVVPNIAVSDPATAEDDCYKMAVYYRDRGYAMTPTNYTGLGGSGHTVKYSIPVSKGLDYVFLVGRDGNARDIDIYVYDEVGNLILKDVRADSRAGIKFRSAYNGTAFAYVHMARASGLAAYAVMVGRRGNDKGEPAGGADPGAPVPAPADGK
jgi:hypothetical protein